MDIDSGEGHGVHHFLVVYLSIGGRGVWQAAARCMERNRGGGAGQTVGDLERGRRQGGAAERVQGEVEEQEVRAGRERRHGFRDSSRRTGAPFPLPTV